MQSTRSVQVEIRSNFRNNRSDVVLQRKETVTKVNISGRNSNNACKQYNNLAFIFVYILYLNGIVQFGIYFVINQTFLWEQP